jgi:hypothetical protein
MNRLTLAGLPAIPGVLLLACGSAPTNPSPQQGSCPATVAAMPSDLRWLPPSPGGAVTSSLRPAGAELDASSAAAPERKVGPNYTGTWSGQYRVIGCSRSCGLGPSVCKEYLPPPGAHFGLRLTLTQQDRFLSGTLDLFNNTGGRIVETGPVTGIVDESEALVISGMTNTTDPSEPSQTTISGWKSVLTGDGNTMTGRFTQSQTFRNFWGTQQLKIDCELVDFRRTP